MPQKSQGSDFSKRRCGFNEITGEETSCWRIAAGSMTGDLKLASFAIIKKEKGQKIPGERESPL